MTARNTPRTLKPCGTVAAARRHQRRGEKTCEKCLAALRGGPRKVRKTAECGTRSGYMRHVRQGTPKCDPCREANAAAHRNYLAGQPATEQRAA